MRKIICIWILLALPCVTRAQQTINYSILVDSVQREFILYVPASYNGSTSVPLVFSFHGLGGNAQAQLQDHDFRPVADTAGFIVAHPLGAPIVGPGLRGWNFGNPALPNDVLFTSEMIDTIAADFNINRDRVYACGMSFGGFFSIFLAGQLDDKIAAIASVAGTILNNVDNSLLVPMRPISLLQIHGTNDNNVAYNGSQVSRSVDYVLDLFVDFNNCDTLPNVQALPNLNTSDGSTVERFVYAQGDNGTTVEHLKVDGGGHTWPGENTSAQGVNRDINGCVEIWTFFSRFDINGAIGTPLRTPSHEVRLEVFVYPNPAQGYITLNTKYPIQAVSIYNLAGQRVMLPTQLTDDYPRIDISSMPPGCYLLEVTTTAGFASARFVKQ